MVSGPRVFRDPTSIDVALDAVRRLFASLAAIQEGFSSRENTPFIVFMLEAILEALSTPQQTPQETPQVRRLLSALSGEMPAREILQVLGLNDRKSFRQRYLLPALEQGYVEMTNPASPRARNQRYRLTARGQTMLRERE